MARKPRSKKSEALEIRVSHEEKQAFMNAVSTRGTTASTVLREAMDLFVRNGRIRRRNIMITTTLIATSAAVLILQTMPEGETQPFVGVSEFNEMDADFDRIVTLEEFEAFRGTARRRLSGQDGPYKFGEAIGVLFAPYGDAVPESFVREARTDPDSVQPACWQALETRWTQFGEQYFAEIDADSDGQLTPREFSDRQVTRRRRTFDWLDVDGNGTLNIDELVADDGEGSGTRDWPEHITTCFGNPPILTVSPVSEADPMLMQFYDLDRDGHVSWEEYNASFE